MTRQKNFDMHPRDLRDQVCSAFAVSDQIHSLEKSLVGILHRMDRRRIYVRIGYNSLRGFCNHALGFSKTQSQRIVTLVRRTEPMVNFGQDRERSDLLSVKNPGAETYIDVELIAGSFAAGADREAEEKVERSAWA